MFAISARRYDVSAALLQKHLFVSTADWLIKTIPVATSRADAVFEPILDTRMKAERLKSTLGVFERSKFFFNLPGILGEAVEAVSYLFFLTRIQCFPDDLPSEGKV